MLRIIKLAEYIFICLLALSLHLEAQDTSCGIIWYPPVQLSPDTLYGAYAPSIATQGDTIHITWGASGLKFPYIRSINGGECFEPLRVLVPDSVGLVDNCVLIPTDDRLYAFFTASLSHGMIYDVYQMYSDDRGDNWTAPRRIVDSIDTFIESCTAHGDTIVLLTYDVPNGTRVRSSTDAGNTWNIIEQDIRGNSPNIALTSGVLHLSKGYGFDSLGFTSWFVTQYRNSTNLGLTWSDSVPISTVNYSRAHDPFMAADDQGDSTVVLISWQDIKYGCLAFGGCGVLGRWSTDNGRSFHPEFRFDEQAAGGWTKPAVKGDKMAVTWSDGLRFPIIKIFVRVSTDRGASWCEPYTIIDGGWSVCPEVDISKTTFHVAWEELIGGNGGHFYIFYRRGTIAPNSTISSFSLQKGWNLVSLPTQVEDARRTTLFPFSSMGAYAYDSGYVRIDTLLNARGYWIKYPTNRSICFSGLPVYSETCNVSEGWNMIGSVRDPVVVDNIITEPEGIISSEFYGFQRGYGIASTFLPGKGYWVKTSQDGRIILSSTASEMGKEFSSKINILDTMNRLDITDATGNHSVLYFGTAEREKFPLSRFVMPPAPPEGIYDVRFASQRMVEVIENGREGKFPIMVSSAEYPLSIAWKTRPQCVAYLEDGKKEILLKNTGTTQIINNASPIFLRISKNQEIPHELSLNQNYPNPFNPKTRISYTLPAASDATLKVYDVFGREVATLISGRQEAGYHEVEWDAGKFATGVYYYRLLVNNAPQIKTMKVKKMVLVK